MGSIPAGGAKLDLIFQLVRKQDSHSCNWGSSPHKVTLLYAFYLIYNGGIMRTNKITCHYFNEESGEFLFTRERHPERGDFCDYCGQDMSVELVCANGANHYWVEYVQNKYVSG